jgi:FlaA1/EpsC-like NDP-sugar epimerase
MGHYKKCSFLTLSSWLWLYNISYFIFQGKMPSSIKSIAIIGAGPAGAITVDALAQEGEFDIIRVFERREKAGGCWLVLFTQSINALFAYRMS